MPGTTARSGRLRRLRRTLRRVLRKPFVALIVAVAPRLYVLYVRLVYATSRIRENDYRRLHDVVRERDGVVALLWHEEVFTVAGAYPYLGFHVHTLASAGRIGDLVTRILERCGYVVFRGGSSSKASRRRADVVRDMVEHVRTHREVIYGITVDGSKGPAYRMKPGGVAIARACGRPVVLSRTWYRRSVRLATWDRTAIPLPLNEIAYYLAGPYDVPEDAATKEGFARFVLRLEDELIDQAAQSERDLGRPVPPNLVKRSAEERAALMRGGGTSGYGAENGRVQAVRAPE